MRVLSACGLLCVLASSAAYPESPSTKEAFKTTSTKELWGYYMDAAASAYAAEVKCDGGYFAFHNYSEMVENYLSTPASRIAAWELFRRTAELQTPDKCDKKANMNQRKVLLSMSIDLLERVRREM